MTCSVRKRRVSAALPPKPCFPHTAGASHGESASFQLSTGIAANRKFRLLCAIAATSFSMLCSSCSPVIWSSRYSAWASPQMRQGLFSISIVCAVTATSSRKNFDKPSIATEKSFCNSKRHSYSQQAGLVGKSQTLACTVGGRSHHGSVMIAGMLC